MLASMMLSRCEARLLRDEIRQSFGHGARFLSLPEKVAIFGDAT